jgi:hypothetical protein
MKLTVEDVSQMTGLSKHTVLQYAWEKKLGKKEGRQKFFTLAEAKKLGGLKDASKMKKGVKKQVAKKRKAAVKAGKVTLKKEAVKKEQKSADTGKRSFWSFLGIGRK